MPIYVPVEASFNPRGVFCPACKDPMPAFRLMVGETHKITCDHCGMVHLGLPASKVCASCGCKKLTNHGVSKEDDTFQFNHPCRPCQEKMAKIKALVTLGGVAYHCTSCGSFGASPAGTPLTTKLKGMFEGRTSFEVDHTDCPECQKKKQPE